MSVARSTLQITGKIHGPVEMEGLKMALYIDGAWEGWSGDTIVQLTDGSVWRQEEYHYEYRYVYRPKVTISGGKMLVEGMHKAIRVRRL